MRGSLSRWRALSVLALALTMTGCLDRVTANAIPEANLKQRASYHVLKHGADENAINELIANKLKKMGLAVTTAPESWPIPSSSDVVVVYVDRWMWDMTPYLLELTIIMRDPKTEFPYAAGNALHGSLTRRSPDEMVDEVLTEIFKGSGS